jgi:hypothetical protein
VCARASVEADRQRQIGHVDGGVGTPPLGPLGDGFGVFEQICFVSKVQEFIFTPSWFSVLGVAARLLARYGLRFE